MPPSKVDKAKQQAAAKKIEDKTFGMKNKNKCDYAPTIYDTPPRTYTLPLFARHARSKQVQQQIAQMKKTAGVDNDKKARAVRTPAILPCTHVRNPRSPTTAVCR